MEQTAESLQRNDHEHNPVVAIAKPLLLYVYLVIVLHVYVDHAEEEPVRGELVVQVNKCRVREIQISICMDLDQLLHWEPTHLYIP